MKYLFYYGSNNPQKLSTRLNKKIELESEVVSVEHKNKLLSENIDLDYLDTLYRSKFKFGTKDEILIKLK